MQLLFFSLCILACAASWVMNIVWLTEETITGLALLRFLGIFFPPLGVVLGFI